MRMTEEVCGNVDADQAVMEWLIGPIHDATRMGNENCHVVLGVKVIGASNTRSGWRSLAAMMNLQHVALMIAQY